MTASTAAAAAPPLSSTQDRQPMGRATRDRSTSACVSEHRGARAGTRCYASLVRDEVRFRLWQLALDGGDAVRAGGVIGEERRRLLAFAVGGHALPEVQGPRRVVSGLGHQHQADVVRLALLRAREGQLYAELGAQP